MNVSKLRVDKCNTREQWFVTANVNGLSYQERFYSEPTSSQVAEAVESFEVNYAGLTEQQRQPVKVKLHHSEVA